MKKEPALRTMMMLWALIFATMGGLGCSKKPLTAEELEQQIADAQAQLAELKAGKLNAREKSLVGTWQLMDGDRGKVRELQVEFTNLKQVKLAGQDFAQFAIEGTFVVDGETLVVEIKSDPPVPASRSQIKSLTAKELVLTDDQGATEKFLKVAK